MVLGQLDISLQKNEMGLQAHSLHKNELKMQQRPKYTSCEC